MKTYPDWLKKAVATGGNSGLTWRRLDEQCRRLSVMISNKKELESAIAHCLASSDLKKKGSTWYREASGTLQVLDLQKSSFGGQFYINLCFVPAGMAVEGAPTPKAHKCPYQFGSDHFFLRFRLAAAGPEDACGIFGHGLFPLRDLHRMDVEILGDLLDGLDPLDRFKRHAGLELGIVSSAFGFHSLCVRFGLQTAPDRHNHSLAPGPDSGVRLRQGCGRRGIDDLMEFVSERNAAASLALGARRDVLLAFHRLEVPSTLNTAFLSTNLIENVLRNWREATGNVRRWNEKQDMVPRWMAAGLLWAEAGFRKIRHAEDLPRLAVALSLSAASSPPAIAGSASFAASNSADQQETWPSTGR